MREKSVKVRFIQKQLEIIDRRLAELKATSKRTGAAEYIEGLIVGKEIEKATLIHLLENCAE